MFAAATLMVLACDVRKLSPEKRKFEGSLLVRSTTGAGRLSWDVARGFVLTPITTGTAVSFSPDHRLLVYSTSTDTRIRDVSSGRERILLPHRTLGAVWSPDARQIAYVTVPRDESCAEVRITSLEGSSRLVYSARAGGYKSSGGAPGRYDIPTVVCGSAGIQGWVDDGRFLMNTFEGNFPHEAFALAIPPDTSTVVRAGDLAMRRLPAMWTIADVCRAKRLAVLVRGSDEYLADLAGTGIENVREIPRDRADARTSSKIGFVPGSCGIYRIVSEGHGGEGGLKKQNMAISMIDPVSLRQVERRILGKIQIWERPVFNEAGDAMIVVQNDSDAAMSDPRRVSLIDMRGNTRGPMKSSWVTLYESGPDRPGFVPLAWTQ